GPTSARGATDLIDALLPWLDAHEAPAEEPGGGWAAWVLDNAGDDVLPAPTEDLRNMLLVVEQIVESGESLGRFLGQIRPVARDHAVASSDGVRMMTIVNAKGLTVRAVVIAAVEDGIIPRPEVDVKEERRLLYVSMTRAREFLYCTWATRRRGPTARSGQARVYPERRH